MEMLHLPLLSKFDVDYDFRCEKSMTGVDCMFIE